MQSEDKQPRILYEDAQLCVCVKPIGVLSEGGQKNGMPELLTADYARRGQPSFVAGVHRLDKIVGGAMVFSRQKAMTGRLIADFAEHRVTKEYLAVLRGRAAPEGVLEDLLFHDSHCNKSFVVQRPRKGVRDAKLAYRLLDTVETPQGPLSLVLVRLFTGRTHQIRVQFSSRGLPLLGDIRYGSKDPNCGCALWSYRLSLPHPRTGARLQCIAPPPDTYPWTLFPAALQAVPREIAPPTGE